MNYKLPADIEKALQSERVDSYILNDVYRQIEEKEKEKQVIDLSKIIINCLVKVKRKNIRLAGKINSRIGNSRIGSFCTLQTSLNKFPDVVNHPSVIYIAASR
ncbi:hypothetical protein A2303_03090 [Candidatus Falkowbacteria bacterium RIFOXYB2_FULL_47_14]|uniref:Uncharacterized protein n=1 Tax=Candidatus Falkowbacteria bacterium RIFOXYA2_FULL_47_19 TaxID=1797994 RepID=A0A1F5SF48_9BACT|nr:MAG: hypothetical protein A2227_07885 [Candidatus Falkowbacteria bacterium RIFOXYA2_FULL_47_19]OGF35174.1 MAG: hypothetical protein A2468_01925 [Candidatus Falkowbacteria bacterium RIFOXYC2_FULL_46_15]OGF43339.1 MAG: hypothetical protein A2303_03090 [Candidatus Falkowbacteria bacterium RIFOXYB2_FULL_47_14]